LREKETTENINLLKAMGKRGQKIGGKLTQFRKSGITIEIEQTSRKKYSKR
jgi:hypothetical protein